MRRAPVWWSLCCGLGAVESLAMAGLFVPISRMGGKRQVADATLRLIGDHPRVWRMVDADPCIVDFWRLVFSGQILRVADIIASYTLDEKDLYDALKLLGPSEGEEERVAAWCCLQRANYYGKPVTIKGGKWSGLAGFAYANNPTSCFEGDNIMRINRSHIARRLRQMAPMRDRGTARLMDLATESTDFRAGDLATFDPPYVGTQGYGAELSRDRVVELARLASSAGARVLIHEAEPVELDGWNKKLMRRKENAGKRTWAATGEWVTFNFEPAQGELFAEAGPAHGAYAMEAP